MLRSQPELQICRAAVPWNPSSGWPVHLLSFWYWTRGGAVKKSPWMKRWQVPSCLCLSFLPFTLGHDQKNNEERKSCLKKLFVRERSGYQIGWIFGKVPKIYIANFRRICFFDNCIVLQLYYTFIWKSCACISYYPLSYLLSNIRLEFFQKIIRFGSRTLPYVPSDLSNTFSPWCVCLCNCIQ